MEATSPQSNVIEQKQHHKTSKKIYAIAIIISGVVRVSLGLQMLLATAEGEKFGNAFIDNNPIFVCVLVGLDFFSLALFIKSGM